MVDCLKQRPLLIRSKHEELVYQLLKFFNFRGIKILDDHKEMMCNLERLRNINEDKNDCQDKLSQSIFEADHNNNVDALSIAEVYVNRRGTFNSKTLLHLSADFGETEFVDIFIKAGVDVNAEDLYNQTPLHLSARKGYTNIVDILLKAGAKVNAENNVQQTPLYWSARNGYTEVVDKLLKAGANVNAEDKDKQTPLHWSAKNGYAEVVEKLIKAGANVNAKDNAKQTPLYWSARKGFKEIVDILLKNEANVNAEDIFKKTPLHWIAQTNHKEVFEILVKGGASVNAENYYKQTPLHWSNRNDQKDIVEILLKAGGNVNAQDNFRKTPLHWCARSGSNETIEILLKAGANVHVEDIDKETPLHFGAKYGHKEIVETLLNAGANVDAENIDKQTPLHWSAIYGQKEIVEILLKAGANIVSEDINKETPFRLSVKFHHDDVAKLLFLASAPVEKRNKWGDSVLNNTNEIKQVKFDGNPASTLFRMRNWIYSRKNKVKFVQKSGSPRTKIENSKTISTTFTASSQAIHSEDSTIKNDQKDISRDSSTFQNSVTSHWDSVATSSGPASFSDSSPSAESHGQSDSELQEVNTIRQEFQDHISKFYPQHIGWETSCSSEVKVAFQAGRIVIPTTINVTMIKNIKHIQNYYGPTTSHIKHVGIVAQGNSQVVVHESSNNKEGNEHVGDYEDNSNKDDTNSNED